MRKLCGFIAALALLLIMAGCGGGAADSNPWTHCRDVSAACA